MKKNKLDEIEKAVSRGTKRDWSQFWKWLQWAAFVLFIIVSSLSLWQYYEYRMLVKANAEAEDRIAVLKAESRKTTEDLRAERARNERVAILRNGLRVYNLRLDGSELTGLIRNDGDLEIGDIEVKAIVTDPDGTEYSQIEVFPSSDGWPLTKGQVRTFRMVLDREPAEGAKAEGYVYDLEVEE